MNQEMQENRTSLHVLLLIVFTVFGILLNIIIIISDWEMIALVPVTFAIFFIWGIHVFNVGTDKQRIYTYIFCISLALVYYAAHDGPITDIPIILCLLIILLARIEDRRLISITGLSYIVYLLEDIFFTGYLNLNTPTIVYSRIALGVVCLVSAVLISNYFIKLNDKAQVKVDEIKADLVAAEKENERFLSNMSHELRTPINAIGGTSNIMLSSDISNDAKSNVMVIKNSARRLTRQIDDVLLYSELQNNRFIVSMIDYEPLSVINDAVTDAFRFNRNSKLEFAIDVDQDLPKVLKGDPVALKNVIVRLLDNTIKFTYIGGGYMHVYTREESYGVNLNIDIYDTGCGITKNEQAKLFEGVYLADSSAERKRGGLGLGLTIVRGIVSLMGGYVYLESKANEGTHVHVTIPSEVIDPSPAFELKNIERYKILYFFNYTKYARAEIAQYYQSIVDHIVNFRGLNARPAHSMEKLRDEIAVGEYTHLFIASNIYRSEPEYIDKLSKTIPVCIFGEPDFKLRRGSRATVIPKPVFTLDVINYLIATADGVVEDTVDYSVDYSDKLVLVVDDDDMNLMVARGILNQMGIPCETVNSGEGAINMCRAKDYNIVFMDYMMPEMNGIKAMKTIREIRSGYYKRVPIVVLTANAVSSAREEFMSEGFDDFMTKPIETAPLKRIIDKYLKTEVKG